MIFWKRKPKPEFGSYRITLLKNGRYSLEVYSLSDHLSLISDWGYWRYVDTFASEVEARRVVNDNLGWQADKVVAVISPSDVRTARNLRVVR